ncbi:galactose mutarotase [Endozoicomonas sp. (ex Bugula neritina AB1)]|nr:galactose mutarotase [Endozoicomonas sp. (ex Bugula neritina AB1)]
MKITKEEFGSNKLRQTVHSYELDNENGMKVVILNSGATIHSIQVPDRHGVSSEVTLGCDTVQQYETSGAYFGAVVGRYANRIAKGRMMIADKTLQLACNNGENHLHGGDSGFDEKIWKTGFSSSEDSCALTLCYVSADGEEGYPGTLKAKVEYVLNHKNELLIRYQAETDKTTVVNLTNHTYFNLKGQGDCLSHRLQINATQYTPVDPTSIPNGDIASVSGTPMDFYVMKTIGQDINADFVQLTQASGYDHNWVFRCDDHHCEYPESVARVEEAESGRSLEVLSTHPGMQFYSGNFLEGKAGRHGQTYGKHEGFCLETQHFPDSPNQPGFPSTILNPGEIYKHQTILRFGILSK